VKRRPIGRRPSGFVIRPRQHYVRPLEYFSWAQLFARMMSATRFSSAAALGLRQKLLPQYKPAKLDIRADAKFASDEIGEICNGLHAEVRRIGDFSCLLGEQQTKYFEFPCGQDIGDNGLVVEAPQRELMINIRNKRDPSIEDIECGIERASVPRSRRHKRPIRRRSAASSRIFRSLLGNDLIGR
jgi:hypothetical protein